MTPNVEVVRGEGGELELASDRDNPERIMEEGQAKEAVYETFAFLTTVVLAHVFDDLTFEQIAKATGRKHSEVRRAWRQAKSILKEHL